MKIRILIILKHSIKFTRKSGGFMFYSFQDVEKHLKQRQQLGIKPGLERVQSLLARTGHPERKIKGIHFAGTNGKGSTMQMVQSALLAHHYRVGVFTSPSFTDVTGHMFINGKAITKKLFLELFQHLLPHIQALDEQEQQPTVFEILTVIAFMYFQENTDIVLIETGMGGRYDTTNCFVPLISVITTIAYDHMEFLGSSIEEIASQKRSEERRVGKECTSSRWLYQYKEKTKCHAVEWASRE